jgi:hypothetical protein
MDFSFDIYFLFLVLVVRDVLAFASGSRVISLFPRPPELRLNPRPSATLFARLLHTIQNPPHHHTSAIILQKWTRLPRSTKSPDYSYSAETQPHHVGTSAYTGTVRTWPMLPITYAWILVHQPSSELSNSLLLFTL